MNEEKEKRNKDVFPTCVGMNRSPSIDVQSLIRVPHVRGDEPNAGIGHGAFIIVFPTCVGMNRLFCGLLRACCRVPHVRGDEPKTAQVIGSENLCSPRAWG